MRRIFLPNLAEKNDEYLIESSNREFHHIKNVLRAKKGDKYTAFNGCGLTAVVKINEILKNKIYLDAESYKFYKQPKSFVNIAISILKPDAFNIVLSSFVQFNIKRIYPFVSKYSYLNKLDNKKVEKWNNIIIDAAKQSKNNHLTFIDKIYTIDEIISLNFSVKFFLDKNGDKLLSDIEKDVRKNYEKLIIIGPEGGFHKKEIESFIKNNFTGIKLKSNILRSEIAFVTSVAIIKYICGEW